MSVAHIHATRDLRRLCGLGGGAQEPVSDDRMLVRTSDRSGEAAARPADARATRGPESRVCTARIAILRGTVAWWNVVPLVALAAALGAAGPRLLRETLHVLPREERTRTSWDADSLADLQSALRRALPAHRRALELRLEPDTARVELQDPEHPDNVDAYEFRSGGLAAPRPVQIVGAEHLEENLFDWRSVVLETVPFLVRTALERAHLDGGQVTLVTIRRDLADEARVKIRVSVNGTRRMALLEADASGNVLALRVL